MQDVGRRDRTLFLAVATGLCGAAAIVVAAWLIRDDSRDADQPVAVEDPLAGFSRPRTVHFAPDGRLLITDLGTGRDDGRVVAVDLERRTREVLWDGLPSTDKSGQRFSEVGGPSAGAMAPDGTLCVVIGDGPEGRGFAEMRCTTGLRVDLKAYEREYNPAGGGTESNPFDLVYAGQELGGWYVSDAAANVVLHVSPESVIRVVGVFSSVAGVDTPEGMPTGLTYWDGRLTTALYGGALLTGGGNVTIPIYVDEHPIAAAPPYQPANPVGAGQFVVYLIYAAKDGRENSGAIKLGGQAIVEGLDRPTGFVRLADGRFVVAEEERGRVRIVEELK